MPGYVFSNDKFYFRFMRAKDRLMLPLAKTLESLRFVVSQPNLAVYLGYSLAEPA